MIALTDLSYTGHQHAGDGQELVHVECHFRANGRADMCTVAIQASLVANRMFPLVEFLKDACVEQVRARYDVPVEIRW